MEEELSVSQGALAIFKATNFDHLQTIDELNKANVSQGSELQRQSDQLSADHTSTLAVKVTLQGELKTALVEVERLNNALVIATEKQESLSATNTELSQLATQKTTENAHLSGKLEVLEQQVQQGMNREAVQLDKSEQMQVRVNELTAQNARLIEQLYQLQRLQEEQK